MKKTLTILLALIIGFNSFACDLSTISITNLQDNGDGTFTYTLDINIELGTADAVFYGYTLSFNSPHNTPTVTGFPSTISTSDLTTGVLTYDLNGHTGSSINSTTIDTDWTPYENLTNVLSYESYFSPTSTTISLTLNVTITGCAESIELNANVNNGGSCIYTVSTGLSCAPCSISSLTSGTQTPCNAGDNTYTQEVTVTYTNPPASGNLIVNGQSFSITASPQTVTLTGLVSDGNPVNVTASFSADPSCTLTSNSLFTAPAPCNAGCNPNNGTWD